MFGDCLDHTELHLEQRFIGADCNWLNWIAPVLLAPLFGVPCGLYRFHHCVMHHKVGSTLSYGIS